MLLHGLLMKLILQRQKEKTGRRRRAENTEANHHIHTEQCRVVNNLIRSAKENHFSSIIESRSGDQRILFQAVNNPLYYMTGSFRGQDESILLL